MAATWNVAVSGDQQVSAVQLWPAVRVPIPGVQPNITIAWSARIGGKLIYGSTTEATISLTARITGGPAFEQLPLLSAPRAAPSAAWTRRLADRLEAQPLPSLGWGAVAFVACIAAILSILILTIVLAVIVGSLTLGGLVAMIVSLGLLAGLWLLRRTLPAWVEQPVVPLVVGLVLYVMLNAIS